MNMQLVTQTRRPDGIFSELLSGLSSETQGHFCYSLEHAYPVDAGGGAISWVPIIPRGKTFTCKRGTFTLESGKVIVTFEVIGVDGHTHILFHIANKEKELKGCVGLGEDFSVGEDGWGITASGAAFAAFMKLQEGAAEFQLEVV